MVASTASEYPLANLGYPKPNSTEINMANRKRNIQIKFWVTEEEKTLIEKKMKLLPTQRYGAYLRKMAIDGYIIYTDTADNKEMNKALSSIGRNINQIAKRLNVGGEAYPEKSERLVRRISVEKRQKYDIKLCCRILFDSTAARRI